jgi:hypothetical protein
MDFFLAFGIGVCIFVRYIMKLIKENREKKYIIPEGKEIDWVAANKDQILHNLSHKESVRRICQNYYLKDIPKAEKG